MEQVLGHQRVWNLTHSKAPQLPFTLIPQRYFSRSVKQKTSIFSEIPAVDKMSTYHDHAARRRAHLRAHLSSTMDADVDYCTACQRRMKSGEEHNRWVCLFSWPRGGRQEQTCKSVHKHMKLSHFHLFHVSPPAFCCFSPLRSNFTSVKTPKHVKIPHSTSIFKYNCGKLIPHCCLLCTNTHQQPCCFFIYSLFSSGSDIRAQEMKKKKNKFPAIDFPDIWFLRI